MCKAISNKEQQPQPTGGCSIPLRLSFASLPAPLLIQVSQGHLVSSHYHGTKSSSSLRHIEQTLKSVLLLLLLPQGLQHPPTPTPTEGSSPPVDTVSLDGFALQDDMTPNSEV